ncbi:MAG: YigZ family protein [Clostridia bacterium]|nr:YigZ family protein [Clostridia bacterium]
MSEAVLYTTLEREGEAEFIEKKSVFIGHAIPVKSEEEAQAYVKKQKSAYMDARHNVWAYLMKGEIVARYSDDGEPGGTAGVPIYEVLRKEVLTDICCVVTRYFGGIMLGAGGLVRAYTKGAKDAVDAAQIKCMAAAEELVVTVDYGLYGRLAQVFLDFDARVTDEQFADNVKITLFIREESGEALRAKLIDTCNGSVDVQIAQKINFDFAQK